MFLSPRATIPTPRKRQSPHARGGQARTTKWGSPRFQRGAQPAPLPGKCQASAGRQGSSGCQGAPNPIGPAKLACQLRQGKLAIFFHKLFTYSYATPIARAAPTRKSVWENTIQNVHCLAAGPVSSPIDTTQRDLSIREVWLRMGKDCRRKRGGMADTESPKAIQRAEGPSSVFIYEQKLEGGRAKRGARKLMFRNKNGPPEGRLNGGHPKFPNAENGRADCGLPVSFCAGF